MDRETLGKLFVGWVIVASLVGTGLILISSPVLTGIGVILLILGIISIIPALVLTSGSEEERARADHAGDQ
ncbi:MAG: hypothetical protein ABEI11_04465 [Haloarculaceae archaeon]